MQKVCIQNNESISNYVNENGLGLFDSNRGLEIIVNTELEMRVLKNSISVLVNNNNIRLWRINDGKIDKLLTKNDEDSKMAEWFNSENPTICIEEVNNKTKFLDKNSKIIILKYFDGGQISFHGMYHVKSNLILKSLTYYLFSENIYISKEINKSKFVSLDLNKSVQDLGISQGDILLASRSESPFITQMNGEQYLKIFDQVENITFLNSKENMIGNFSSVLKIQDTDEIIGIKDEENYECRICLSNNTNVCIIPCGHLCLCGGCSEELLSRDDKCPICRKKIWSLFRVYT